MIYPFWLLLFLKQEIALWLAGLAVVLVLLAYFGIRNYIPIEAAAAGMSIAIVVTGLRLARYFLVRMVVDFDARNGEGVVILERLVPAPNLPESIQISLQDAAEGTSSINTLGVLNTLITFLKPLRFLRILSVGDLTLRTKAGEFALTMYGIQDPVGVKNKIQGYWKQIAAAKAKQAAERDRQEQIDRMSIAVAKGLQLAQQNLKVQLVRPVDGPAPAAGSPPGLTGPRPPAGPAANKDEQGVFKDEGSDLEAEPGPALEPPLPADGSDAAPSPNRDRDLPPPV